MRLIPTFSFIDPFGYKGLSWALVRSVIKDWGSDCVFFFNYSRINAGVSNPRVFPHMAALFGTENFQALREEVGDHRVARESAIMRHLTEAMREAGATHVLPFRFANESGRRTTHHLVFVTKHPTGYEIMKEIMAAESSHGNQGVPSFEYSPALLNTHMLFEDALDELEDELTVTFAGQRLTREQIYHKDNLGRPYIKKNYRDALLNLERAERIKAEPAVRRAGTFAEKVVAIFPNRPIGRS
jgi:hypothetical protein